MKTKCKLVSINDPMVSDGNIFSLMGIASRALKKDGKAEEAKEMCDKIMGCGSYDEALMIIMDYVEENEWDEE